MSGTQWPAAKGGSSHSETKTRGEVSTSASAARTRSSRRRIPPASSSAPPSASKRTPSPTMEARIWSRLDGEYGTTSTSTARALTISSSVSVETAQTSQRSCATTMSASISLPGGRVHGVQRLPVLSSLDDGPVDLGARQLARVEERRGDGGAIRRLGRPVALVRDAHDLLSEPEGEEDLGGGGDEEQIRTDRTLAGGFRYEADVAAGLENRPADRAHGRDLLQPCLSERAPRR